MTIIDSVPELGKVPGGTVAMFDLGEGNFACFEAQRDHRKLVWLSPGDTYEYTPDDLAYLLPATVVYTPGRRT